MSDRNHVKFVVVIDGEPASHFSAHEFENRAGIACVSKALITGLELARRDLNREYGLGVDDEILVCVSEYGGIRTDADNIALAAKLGWTDEGGRVSRDSRHLLKYGGIAADIYAVHKWAGVSVAQALLWTVAERHFDFTRLYDGHVHVDQRRGGKKLED